MDCKIFEIQSHRGLSREFVCVVYCTVPLSKQAGTGRQGDMRYMKLSVNRFGILFRAKMMAITPTPPASSDNVLM